MVVGGYPETLKKHAVSRTHDSGKKMDKGNVLNENMKSII